LVKEILAENNVTTPQYPLYCPDLAAGDFYLLPGMKLTLKGRRFCGATDVIKKARKSGIKKKVKCTLVQALRLCTGRTAHRGE
jgi:hypothetical protein